MLPSVARESIELLPLSSRGHHAALTTDAVIKQTHLRPHGKLVYRQMADMFWSEHEDVSSLHNRVSYINNVVNQVRQTIPSKEHAITLISFGSGGVLMEYFIHTQLQHAGYRDISWRVIDIDYGDYENRRSHAYGRSLEAFSKITSGRLLVHCSEQNYFDTSHGGRGASDDRSRGATVLLAIDPPTTEAQAAGETFIDPAYMSVKGRPVEDIADANCLYLVASEHENKDRVDLAIAALTRGDKVVTLGSIIKCYVNTFGGCDVVSTQSERSLMMKEDCKPFLDQAKTTKTSRSIREVTLSDIKGACERYIATRAEGALHYAVYCVSDYDVSLTRLREHIIGNHHATLLARFEMNTTTIENYP